MSKEGNGQQGTGNRKIHDKNALKQKAFLVLSENVKSGYSKRLKKDYFYICPSRKTYPFQWFWDSCFHAIVMRHFDAEMAKRELLSLVSVQREDGFLPHTIFWEGKLHWWAKQESYFEKYPYITAEIQPPVIAYAVLKIYEKDGDKSFVKEIYPALNNYYNYLASQRDPDKDGLISIIQSRESGMDFSSQYDELWKRKKLQDELDGSDEIFAKYKKWKWNLKNIFASDIFNVEDVLVNSIYAESLWCMAELAKILSKKKDMELYKKHALLCERTIQKKCWDEEDAIFYSLSGKSEKFLRVKTCASLMPLILRTLDKKKARVLVKNHLLNKNEFFLPYPVPSVAKNEPSFNPEPSDYIWRGTTWLNINWYIARGLKMCGFHDEAKHIAQKSKELVEKSGFYEYFNPLTGAGGGAQNFGWSTLVADMIILSSSIPP